MDDDREYLPLSWLSQAAYCLRRAAAASPPSVSRSPCSRSNTSMVLSATNLNISSSSAHRPCVWKKLITQTFLPERSSLYRRTSAVSSRSTPPCGSRCAAPLCSCTPFVTRSPSLLQNTAPNVSAAPCGNTVCQKQKLPHENTASNLRKRQRRCANYEKAAQHTVCSDA